MRRDEFRKLQLTGNSTYTVSLPKKWIQQAGLKQGDYLSISRLENGSLILSPKSPHVAETNEITIKAAEEESPSTLSRKVISAYLGGYNLIRIVSEGGSLTPAQRASLKSVVRNKLIGTEVVVDSSNEISLQALLTQLELPVDTALRRMTLISLSMHKDAIESLRRLDKGLAFTIIETDDEVDRFSLYIVRLLKLSARKGVKSGGGFPDHLGYMVATKSIERVADHAVKIAQNITRMKKTPDETVYEKISEVSSFTTAVFTSATKAFFTGDYNMADDIIEMEQNYGKLESNFLALILAKRMELSEFSNLRLILESLRRTAEYATDIAEVVLNSSIEKATPSKAANARARSALSRGR